MRSDLNLSHIAGRIVPVPCFEAGGQVRKAVAGKQTNAQGKPGV